MKNIWIVALLAAVFACESGENDFVTESGVEVSCIIKGEGEAFVKDSVLLLNLEILTDDNKVLVESAEQPMPLLFNPEMVAGHLQEVLNKMGVGDSVYFETTASNLFTETYKTAVPDSLDSASTIKVAMRAIDMMTRQAFQTYQMEMQEKMLAGQLDEDVAAIDAYLEENGIEAQKTESGLRYVITQEGNGNVAKAGDNVSVHYVGRLLEGPYFDTSVEEVAKEQNLYDERRGYEPFQVVIGQGRVIKGWDEGIPLIPEGGKGTLYIPSPLGYGSRGAGSIIKPFSILQFEVEVLKVEPQPVSIN